MATSSTSTSKAGASRSREWTSRPGSRAGRRRSPTIAREFWPATRCWSDRRRKGRSSNLRCPPHSWGGRLRAAKPGGGIRFSGSNQRHPRFASSFEGGNRGLVAFDQPDLVQPTQQAVTRERVDLEAVGKTLAPHLLRFEVDRDLGGRVFGRQVDEVAHLARRQRHRKKSGLVAVGQED